MITSVVTGVAYKAERTIDAKRGPTDPPADTDNRTAFFPL